MRRASLGASGINAANDCSRDSLGAFDFWDAREMNTITYTAANSRAAPTTNAFLVKTFRLIYYSVLYGGTHLLDQQPAIRHEKAGSAAGFFIGAPGGTRTPNDGSEDHSDIHFTTGATRILSL